VLKARGIPKRSSPPLGNETPQGALDVKVAPSFAARNRGREDGVTVAVGSIAGRGAEAHESG